MNLNTYPQEETIAKMFFVKMKDSIFFLRGASLATSVANSSLRRILRDMVDLGTFFSSRSFNFWPQCEIHTGPYDSAPYLSL